MAVFVIRGARGTMPICGEPFVRYGGNTTCFSVRTPHGILVFDAGTGICNVAREVADNPSTGAITLFFTHLHMDHLMGLPCFQPIHDPRTDLRMMADPRRSSQWQTDLRAFVREPFWPVGLHESQARMTLTDLPIDEQELEVYGCRVSWMRVPHPQQCLSYKIAMPEATVVIATDVEYAVPDIDPEFIAFCAEADHLIMDAQYTPDEFSTHRGWGHSTWEAAALVAREAGVGRLVLTHHAPSRTDEEIDRIVEDAAGIFSPTVAAADNMVLVGTLSGDRPAGPIDPRLTET